MFKPSNVNLFMGGQFRLDPHIETAEDLADLFDAWSKEVKTWNKEELSEVEIVKGEIVVTLKEGIPLC